MGKFLKDKCIEGYLAHNVGKSVIAKGFNGTLNYKISKYMTAATKNVYIDKLSEIVKEYNHTSTLLLR